MANDAIAASGLTETDLGGNASTVLPIGFTQAMVDKGLTTLSPPGMGLIDTDAAYNVSQYQYGPTSRQIQGRYFPGNEWDLASKPVEQQASIQDLLARAGFLTEYRSGVWDVDSATALREVMAIANFSESTYEDILNRVINAGGLKKVKPTTTSGMATPTMTDEDIRTVANKTAQGVLGRNLREDEVSSFIPAFRGMFAGGTSAATAGEMVVREQIAPEEAGAYGIGNVMQAIGTALGGAG